jgi:hypothetical protein
VNIVTAPRRDSKHWTPGSVTWGEIVAWLDTPAQVKECGGYILGELRETTIRHPGAKRDCTGLHRSKAGIASRSALTLDADTPDPKLPEQIELLTDYSAIVHTTFSSIPDQPRYRVILPLSRPVTPEEYHALATVLITELGEDQFDPGSVQPERFMYRPSSQGEFQSWVIEGEPVPVDDLLADYDPDLSHLPVPRSRNKRDPYEIEGTVGAFNRSYPEVADVVEAYGLPYEPADADRWQLVGATAVAGLNPVSPGLVYSHHITDPAYGQTCSSFDLVRLHRFGELDEGITPGTPVNRLPSQTAMLELASMDPKVVADLVGVDFSTEMEEVAEDNGWKLRLRLHSRTGRMLDEIYNWDLIRDNDPTFAGLYYNEFSLTVETDTDLPWRPVSRGGPVVSATDRAALCHYIERTYQVRPQRFLVDELINTCAQQRYVNPVRDYLEELKWDGVPRVEESLPGVHHSPYTRMVARKSLVAAVARALDPGCKWDHTLVLYGPEGIGKSWWVDRMARGYSATLGQIGDKDTLLTMQRSWIMVSDEGYSLRKADSDVQKEFLTRTSDVFRSPYDRDAIAHPRHCVIWGTTNDEVFLRRQEGNRRFLIVRCVDRLDFTAMTEEYIDQVWAEAVALYRGGELLFLSEEETALAADEREGFTEEDALAGLVEEFLETPVPDGWEEMSPDARKNWMAGRADGLTPVGTHLQTVTCSTQLWVEALGNRLGAHSRTDLLQLNTVLKRLPGWRAEPTRRRMPYYGPQVVFRRMANSGGD